jgi:phosphatidate cytidylyltransferase
MIGPVDPVVVAFARVVAVALLAVLVAIGIVALIRRGRDPQLTRELWLRWRSWVVMAAAVLGALALGPAAWIGLVALLAVAAFREYASVVGVATDRTLHTAGVVLVAGTYVAAWWTPAVGSPGPGISAPVMAMPVWSTVAILVVAVARDRFEGSLRLGGATLVGVVCCGGLLGHLALLANLPGGSGLVLFVVALAAVNDVAACGIGTMAGRHPLRPKLSPRKTVEGAVGAAVVVLMAAWELRWLVPGCGTAHVLALAGAIAAAGTAGDLALAALKRDAGVKDWSAAIPGHGGVLDRLNSLLFAAPLSFHYVAFHGAC